jgi:hypothetical protein
MYKFAIAKLLRPVGHCRGHDVGVNVYFHVAQRIVSGFSFYVSGFWFLVLALLKLIKLAMCYSVIVKKTRDSQTSNKKRETIY